MCLSVCVVLSLSLSLEVQSCPSTLLKPCCLKEQFCVLWTEDLEQKDGEAQGSTVRHMLSIKRPAINTRYTAPGQHDRGPGGGEGSPEEGRRKRRIGKERKEERGFKSQREERKKTETGISGRKSETEEGQKEARVKRQYKQRQSVECKYVV